MDQNPYAPPRRDAQLQPSGGDFGGGEPRSWEIGEVISESWGIFKQHWPVLVGAGVVLYVILMAVNVGSTMIFGGGFGRASSSPSAGMMVGTVVSMIAQQVVQAFLMVGLNRIYLTAARGQTPDFGMLFSGGDRFVTALLATLLMLAAIFGGVLLLIVPGIILSIGLYNTMFYAADTNLGVVDCLKASWNSLNGQKGQFFVFLIVTGLLAMSGMLACFVGLLVTAPLALLSLTIVYTRVSGRMGPEPVATAPAY